MSQENVELVQATYNAWNAGDLDALGEMYDPAGIMQAPVGWPEQGPFVGREAIMRQWHQMHETWETDASEVVSDYFDIGDRVAVRFIWHGRGHGPQSHIELTSITTVRKGMIVYQEFFWDHTEALEAVGVSEQDAQAGS